MAVNDVSYFEYDDIADTTAEGIFQRLIQRGNGGTIVRSTAAPALSTQFVKSNKPSRLQPGADGYLASIIYPCDQAVNARYDKKHDEKGILGYDHTKATDGYSGGFGERSARALAREENTYQFKGTFPSAMLAFAKLRARVEARGGNVVAINRIFAMLWGLAIEDVSSVPHLHVDGSEATRMSAMEDRAYHALSGHPGHNGGYRVDLATIAADAIGSNVPLNWPRIRTALKAIALCQTQGDAQMQEVISALRKGKDAEFGMDLVLGSQPQYVRGYPWEVVLDRLMTECCGDASPAEPTDAGYAMTSRLVDSYMDKLKGEIDSTLIPNVQRIATMVTKTSSAALRRTVQVILDFDRDRAMVDEGFEKAFEELDVSTLSASYEVPRYKLTRDSVRRGFSRPFIGKDNLPDMRSHGKSARRVDLAEFRESHLGLQLNIAGVLNLAVYLACLNSQSRSYAYQLMTLVKVPQTEQYMKRAVALRRQELYSDPRVLSLGPLLFGDSFINTVDMLIRNLVSPEYRNEISVKREIWKYLSDRCPVKRKCPYPGDWKNMMGEILDQPESWTLYYWVRVSIGRAHHAATDGILAPIAAGQVTDFATLMKKSVREKARRWTELYSAEYKKIEDKLTEKRLKMKEKQSERVSLTEEEESSKYVPPHLRRMVNLEATYDAEEILNRDKKYKAHEYRRMVEMQSKAKFFKAIDVFTKDSRITIGVTDEKMYQMLVEFYQARWFSLEKRINKAKEQGKVFMLGDYPLPEHPWGPLNTDLPTTYEGMLEYVCTLDEAAWTLPPDYLQKKFRKSIGELWDDVSDEISKICVYIDEVCRGVADEQDEADAESTAKSIMNSTIGVSPIVIPAYGYVPPFMLPRQTIDVEQPSGEMAPVKITPGMADPIAKNVAEPDGMGDFEDMDDYEGMDEVSAAPQMSRIQVEYLTYREIWHQLSLPDVPDERKRLALALPMSISLDDQHMENQYGPPVQDYERHLTARRWAAKKDMIMFRLTRVASTMEAEDM